MRVRLLIKNIGGEVLADFTDNATDGFGNARTYTPPAHLNGPLIIEYVIALDVKDRLYCDSDEQCALAEELKPGT